jgi:NADH dehydrogenase
MSTQTAHVPHVVIVGGGFGGLNAARALKHAPVTLSVVDRRNHHLFQPLLYQVATAALSPADIAAPIRGVLHRQTNAEVLLGEATDVDLERREVVLTHGRRLPYDFLVIATGATHAYFGHPEWEPVAPGLKTVEDATEIRRRFLLAFEAAEQELDPARRRALLTFAVVGGGPTGVEMAGAMAEVARHALVRDFRHIDPSTACIVLLEGGPRILPTYDEELSAKATRGLEKMGVQVRTHSIVTGIEPGAVYVGEERIATGNVVWAAGVTASPLGKKLGVPTDRVGRVVVERDCTIPGHPEVFVIGDLAEFRDEHGQILPGVAPVAMQMGKYVARAIRRTVEGKPREPFHYWDKGSLATIGRWRAVLQTGKVKLYGWVAWLAWLFIHIMYLIGFRNRASVFLEWAWSYLTWQRGARLITGEDSPGLSPMEWMGGEPAHMASPGAREAQEAATPPGARPAGQGGDPGQARAAGG